MTLISRLTDAEFLQQLCDAYRDIKLHHGIPSTNRTERQHLMFLAMCSLIAPDANLGMLSAINPYGGMIGYGNSRIFNWLMRHSKVMCLHAALHDAHGFMYSECSVGPGYCYASPSLPSRFWLGHITGIIFCIKLKLLYKSLVDEFDV